MQTYVNLCKLFLSTNTLNSSCFKYCQLSYAFIIHIIHFYSQFEKYMKPPAEKYSSSQNSDPIDLLVKEISFWYLSILFFIDWEIWIYQWLINFQLVLHLFRHYTWVAGKLFSLNHIFWSQSCWSSCQSVWLILVKGFRL